MKEFDTCRRLVEVDADYGITIRSVRGRWLVHCGLCKHRRSFTAHADAASYATAGHLARLVHQKNVGRVQVGGHLSSRRGYDISTVGYDVCSCGVCDRCVDQAEYRARCRATTPDRAAVRPVVPLPAIRWESRALGRRAAVRVDWHDGRLSWGTEYGLWANGSRIHGIQLVALEWGGWLLNGQLMPTDADVIRAVA